ncbi:hypothetical protein FALBO_11203 [Fusarium albosuccineum]|uniref:Uncharacterized protein n=1 Tax=Fusarium albosuccineum TaxID=1237068 RepID=A0A8H4L4N3_9HYPO|nr:hypothetical protein FALBO_11203 [Fusarium albosuccineum]
MPLPTSPSTENALRLNRLVVSVLVARLRTTTASLCLAACERFATNFLAVVAMGRALASLKDVGASRLFLEVETAVFKQSLRITRFASSSFPSASAAPGSTLPNASSTAVLFEP